jgi:hypothetical protein
MKPHPLAAVWAICRELDRRHNLLLCDPTKPNPIPDPREER